MSSHTPNVFDPRVFARAIPHEDFDYLRTHDPVSWQEEHRIFDWPAGPGFWAVTRHRDVKHVLRSPQLYSSWLGATQIRDADDSDLDFIRQMMLNMDPPQHHRLRTLASAIFTPRRLERFSDQIDSRASDLLDSVVGGAGCDLPSEVTDDFPLANLADLLGVPLEDRDLLLRWTNRVIGYQDPEHADPILDSEGVPVNPRSPAMLTDMFDYALRLAERKRAEPADDLMTALVQAEVDGSGLSDTELKMFFFLVVIAGNDTVRSALPGGALALAEHPQQQRMLRAQPELLRTAIEEMLRWHPPVLSFRRTATADTQLGGRQIRSGDKVVVYHASANFDPEVFEEPRRFNITRAPGDHLAFGQGPHLCLGAHFARLQMRIFFTQLLHRVPEFRLAAAPQRLTSNFINGLTRLPLTWN